MAAARVLYFQARSSASFSQWKENEVDLFYHFELTYNITRLKISPSTEDKCLLLEIEAPLDKVALIERDITSGIVSIEIDKINGIRDRKDTKITKVINTAAPMKPENKIDGDLVEALEAQLVQLEIRDHARTMQTRAISDKLNSFQAEMLKSLEQVDKKIDDTFSHLDEKCQRLEKLLQKYKN